MPISCVALGLSRLHTSNASIVTVRFFPAVPSFTSLYIVPPERRNPHHNVYPEMACVQDKGHPMARRLNDEQRSTVRNMAEIGSRPRDILAMIRNQTPETLTTERDVYNIRLAVRNQKLGGNSPLQFLRQHMEKEDWKFAF